MNPTRSLIVASLLITLAIAAIILAYRSEKQHRQEMELARQKLEAIERLEPVDQSAPPLDVKIFIYRPQAGKSATESLEESEQSIAAVEDPVIQAQRMLNLVMSQSAPVLPPTAQVRQVFLMDEGLAVVDLSRETGEQLQGGISSEYGVLISLARTLRANLPAVQKVRFLVEGEERPTLSGHVSLQNSFM